MLHVRVLKTKGISKSVQVYRYKKGKRIIIEHIGSAQSDEQIKALQEIAKVFIADRTKRIYIPL